MNWNKKIIKNYAQKQVEQGALQQMVWPPTQGGGIQMRGEKRENASLRDTAAE